ncbi:unnamed protein product [Lupinus luteus]|uniref:Seed biotin-containing protein SBP65 n=1 Tax=Lupinus luteus TaxID=3873 RepID=A0AAV1XR91_LUPLU
MASQQVSRRENTTNERDVHVEKNRVPKMATHFEHLAEQAKDDGGKDTPQGSWEELQGGEYNKDHAGKAIGDVGGHGRARETRDLGGAQYYESLADKEGGVGGGGGVGPNVGKFEIHGGGGRRNEEELERRTRVGIGRESKVGGDSEGVRGREINVGRDAEGVRVGESKVGGEPKGATAVITCRLEKDDEQKGRGREEEILERAEKERLEEISKYRQEAKQNQNEAISAAQERYERAKQAANETLSNTTQTTQEKASQAKDIALEKGQQGYGPTKDTITQAKDTTIEKGQQGYATTKDTITSAAKTAVEYTVPVAEKAKDYTIQAAVKTKDVTLETGKSAAQIAGKVAVDLKDKATVAGWTAAHYSTQLTVDGTKAAANVVEGAAGYAGHKAAELATKSVGAVKGLAATAGETVKEYTARKKEEAKLELEAKREAQPQVAGERPSPGIGETISQYIPTGESLKGGQTQGSEGTGSTVLSAIGETVGNVGEKIKKPFESITEGSSENDQTTTTTTNIGETLGDVAQMVKKPMDNITEGGSQVVGAVGETVGEIGKTMIKPAEKVQELGQDGQGGGVFDAIGETIVEIAQTTKNFVVGEGLEAQSQSTEYGKHGVGSVEGGHQRVP